MQSKAEIEKSYETPDPWGYKTNPNDEARKTRILGALYKELKRTHLPPWSLALDIGAGEGWVTRDLPALQVDGYEISDFAASRFPENVRRVSFAVAHPYDLVTAMGVMYGHYDWRSFLDKLLEFRSSATLLLCNIAEWERPEIAELGEPSYVEEFKYREYVERLRIYVPPAQHR